MFWIALHPQYPTKSFLLQQRAHNLQKIDNFCGRNDEILSPLQPAVKFPQTLVVWISQAVFSLLCRTHELILSTLSVQVCGAGELESSRAVPWVSVAPSPAGITEQLHTGETTAEGEGSVVLVF